MGWDPVIHPQVRPGRTTRYTFRIGGKLHDLGMDRRAAERKAKILRAQHLAGEPTRGPEPETVAELVALWQELRPGRDWEVAAWAVYAGTVELDDLGPDHWEEYVRWLHRKYHHRHEHTDKTGLSARSVRGYFFAARAALRYARDRQWTSSEPRQPKLPRPPEVARDLPPQKLRGLFDALPERAGRILRFCIDTGCRPGEACSLVWGQVDLKAGTATLREHKTAQSAGRDRVIFLSPSARSHLGSPRRPTDPVFPSRLGKRYTVAGLRSILRRAAPGLTLYQLRHTFAQFHSDHGLDDTTLAGLLGHTDTRTVRVYRQLRAQRLRNAAASLSSPLQPEHGLTVAGSDGGKKRKKAKKKRPQSGGRSRTRGRATGRTTSRLG